LLTHPDRNEAYNHWAVDQAPHDNSSPIILKAGYLTRTAKLSGSTLALTGDLNATTPIEVLGGASKITELTFNGETFPFKVSNETGAVAATIDFPKPRIVIPQMSELSWKVVDALPELQDSYDDKAWKNADLKKSFNSLRPLNTPTSLYASDYGFHTGSLVYRGTFTATGSESKLSILAQGGSAFGASAFLDDKFLSSFTGFDAALNGTISATLPNLQVGKTYTITVAIDHMGLDENWTIGTESMKNPRGILDYTLDGHNKSSVSWKLTGNLGGEDYADLTRGPLNEGGFYPERAGYHLPGAYAASSIPWKPSGGPVTDGLSKAGIAFYAAEFNLNLPSGYDIPLSFTIPNNTASAAPAHRVQLYVNGWQYGKFVSNVGPQTVFPVPEGILNYQGSNYVALSLWGLDAAGVKLGGFELGIDSIIWRGFKDVKFVEGVGYEAREGVY
jgi:hypothetical protein